MNIRTHILSADHNQLIVPFIRKMHDFSSYEEARRTILHECETSREVRGVFFNDELHGVVSWQERGAPKHGVAEIIRFSVMEDGFSPQIAEFLLDTSLASMDNFFRTQGSQFRKLFMAISARRFHSHQFLEDQGFLKEGQLLRHYHDNRNELVYSLFRKQAS